MNYFEIAAQLDNAALHAKAMPQISSIQDLNVQDAYLIQALSITRRYTRGDLFTGLKMGFTSFAKMAQMGINDMIWGRLTKNMLLEQNSTLYLSKYIHPRAEPEIAFRIYKDIDRELTIHNCKDYVDGISVAIEIIDSRYENFKFSLEDVIADNCSSSSYVCGTWHDVHTPIQNKKMTLSLDDDIVEEGMSDDILGDPWLSFCAATRLAMQYHESLPAGSIILAGAATSAHYIKDAHKVTASAKGLGTVTIQISK